MFEMTTGKGDAPHFNSRIAGRYHAAVVAFAFFLGICSSDSTAGDWTSSSSIQFTETYTDNLNLSPEDKQSKLVTFVTPSLQISGGGSRFKADLDAALEFNSLGGDAEHFRPRIIGSSDFEVLEEHFFIDTEISAIQTTVDPFSSSGLQGRGSSGDRSLTGRGNETTQYYALISPYFVAHLKDYANFRLQYGYDQQLFTDNVLGDSASESVNMSLVSGSAFSVLSWGLTSSYRNTNYDRSEGQSDSDNEYISSEFNLGYRLSRHWQLTSSYGREWNDFSAVNPNIDDNRWTAGVVWTPNTRARIRVGYGNRFFGDTPSVDISYRHKRSSFRANYSKQLTDTRSLRTQQNILASNDQFALVLDPNTGQVIVVPLDLTTPTNSTLINEQTNINYSIKGVRTTVNLYAQESRQTQLDFDIESIFSTSGVNLTRRLSAKLSFNAGATLSKQEDASGLGADTIVVYWGLDRRMGNNASLGFNYSNAERSSDRPDDDYTENRLSLSFTFQF